jgi:hypothetical protein
VPLSQSGFAQLLQAGGQIQIAQRAVPGEHVGMTIMIGRLQSSIMTGSNGLLVLACVASAHTQRPFSGLIKKPRPD